MRRAPLLAAAAVAVAGLLVLVTSGRTWGSGTLRSAGTVRQHLAVTGHGLTGALSALGLALLALAVGVVASSGLMRKIAGLLVVVVGAAAVPVAAHAHGDVRAALAGRAVALGRDQLAVATTGWWLVAVAGGVLAAAAGAVVVVRGGRWTRMSERYDAPATARAAPEPDAWTALDRGEDPTVDA